MKIFLLQILIFMFFSSCETTFEDYREFANWLNEPENGFVKTRSHKNIRFRVKYLPAEYLVFRELQNSEEKNGHTEDSLFDIYQKNRTFLLTIAPNEDKNDKDILASGVRSMEDFIQRAQTLNFDMSDYVTLETGKNTFRPVLSTMENVYGMKKHRNIYLVFSPQTSRDQLLMAKEYDFIFDDEIFGTGINHFLFRKKDIDNIPECKFLKSK